MPQSTDQGRPHMSDATTRPAIAWHLFVPKLFTCLAEGYGRARFRADMQAGITVAIVALPLAMALAIASGATPDKGLVTVVVAGLVISALGGSRVQIGGPTGAFVVVVFTVIDRFGHDGLVLATLMAGVMLVAAGLFRFGTWIKYMPEPVVTGFTAGIAILIASSQIKDATGIALDPVPAGFLEKFPAFWAVIGTVDPATLALSLGSLAAILGLRRWAPGLPAYLIAIVAASAAVRLAGLEVDTIGSRFGGIPSSLPVPALPAISLARAAELLPSAFTIAFLAGVESLLSAVVADGMTGYRHRSNCELVAQGVANGASALFTGLPATGAIARTVTNIRSGAETPVAGIVHALVVLLFMLVFSDLAAFIPLASLSAVLLVVAWNMSEAHKVVHLMKAPFGDRLVLALTLGLTVLVDLTVAIEVGVVLATILFMHRMAEAVAVETGVTWFETDVDDFDVKPELGQRAELPPDVEVFKFHGPLFFGVASRLDDMLDALDRPPRAIILRMARVPLMDASGVAALSGFVSRCNSSGCAVILTAIQSQPRAILAQMGMAEVPGRFALMPDFETAVAYLGALDPGPA